MAEAASSEPIVVIVEDEAPIRRVLRAALEGHGYRVFEAGTGADGLTEVATRQPDVVLVDLGLPDIDGLEVIHRLREWSTTHVIVLSARGQEREKIAGLDAGADDYLTKPFSVEELLARMRAALRHAARRGTDAAASVFVEGDLKIDLARRRVSVGETDVHLTPIEYRLLTTLVRYAGRVVTHRQLLKEVWGPRSPEEPHYLRVHMAQLRRKLEADPARPRYLLTEPGVGYRLAASD